MFTAPRKFSSADSLFPKLALLALFALAAPAAAAQDTTPTPSSTPAPTPAATPSPSPAQTPTPTPAPSPTPSPSQTETPTPTPTATPAAVTGPAAAPADEPLFRQYKGVALGMSLQEVRGKLGQPKEKDKTQDIFIFSENERARVYYDSAGKASAVIITYIGKTAGAPEPKSVIGTDIEPNQAGALYKLVTYPRAGYWVAYSRTAGDEPLTVITMQRVATTTQ
jgi:hypothetical protein